MKELINIKNSVREVADAISSILSVDVTIINTDLIRIAATGLYKDRIGEQLPKDCSYSYILTNKKPELIIEKGISQRCHNCQSSNQCQEVATIGYPILSKNNETLGVIGLIAFNQEQKEYIYSHQKEIDLFLKKLSLLLAGNLNYEATINNLSLRNEEFSNIVNALDYGIILADSDFKIINYNNKIQKLLGIGDGVLKEVTIFDIFKNFNPKNKKSIYYIKGRPISQKNEFIVRTIENSVNGKVQTYIFQVSSYSKELINAYNIIEDQNNVNFEYILGNSAAIRNTINLAKQVAEGDSSVMIRGESGTGKELFAKSIHKNSPRKYNSYISINCASIPDNLLESELFGYEEGAFTGARVSGKVGRLELANGGTLFLDEIGDLPLSLQPKLLRVLQDGNFVRLGGKRVINVDFRLISATNRNLEEMVAAGEFREDLYYRLNVIPLELPPLRDRKEDIKLIAESKLSDYCIMLGKDKKVFSNELMEIFKNAYWKGNVRELENVIEYLVNVSTDKVISPKDLPPSFNSYRDPSYTKASSLNFKQGMTLQDMTDEFEKNIISNLLTTYGETTKSKKIISEKLGINLSTLYRKLYRFNLN
ncbi:sigma-54 interaction domain-containing protein [Peptoniphilus catoniae]|uniref:sigma-54 interaction domain-containing protein n=1 Tax=Peptoniphilus catoniae TaxID=1660341 RepID=UPI0010FDD148|nr:sigma 54-interacting transcriptional regulator [Peptoniphilus catoniae]